MAMRSSIIAQARILAVLLAMAACVQAQTAIGKAWEVPLGTTLSAMPELPPDRVVAGSPALIVDEKEQGGARWLRILAADGTHGWTKANPSVLADAVSESIEVLDRGPDAESDDGPKTVKLAGPAKVLGASTKVAAASPQELMLPPDSNWLNAPMLHLESQGQAGWAFASQLRLTCSLKRRGLIRLLFVRPVLASRPQARQLVARVSEDGETVAPAKTGYMELDTWKEQSAEYVGPAGQTLSVASGTDSHLLRFSRGGVNRYLIFEKYQPLIASADLRDLNGDGSPEWLLEISQLTGDGARPAFWIVSDAGALRAWRVDLGEDAGESPTVVWDSGQLWSLKADAASTAVHLIRLFPAGPRVVPMPGAFARIAAESRETRPQAMADAIALGPLFRAIPLSEGGSVRWVAGRLFRTARQAALLTGVNLRTVALK